VRVGREAAQHHFLSVLDFFGVGITPFERDFGVGVCVDEHVEGTVPIEHGEERHGCSDLAEEGLDLLLDVFL
jgi:hypothetical protein